MIGSNLSPINPHASLPLLTLRRNGLDMSHVGSALTAGVRPNLQAAGPVNMPLQAIANLFVTTAPVVSGLVLGAGVLAVWGFGTGGSIRQAARSTRDLRLLRAQRLEFDALASAPSLGPAGRQALAAMRSMNATSTYEQRVTLGLLGGLAGVTTGVIGAGMLLSPGLLGSLGAGVAATGATMLAVGVPLLSVFAAGIGVMRGHQAAQAARDRGVPAQVATCTATGHESAVAALLGARLHRERLYNGLACASLLGVAVGAPLTLFGGPYGLAVLVPSFLATFVVDYLRRQRLGYVSQLTDEEKVGLGAQDALVVEIARTHAAYALLKQVKERRRVVYPYGRDTPLGPLFRAVNGLRNRLNPARLDGIASPEEVLATFAAQHREEEKAFSLATDGAAAVLPAAFSSAGPASGRLESLLTWAESLGFGVPLAATLAVDSQWAEFVQGGDQVRTDAFAVEPEQTQEAMLQQAYLLAESLLLRAGKTSLKFRERELLDLLRACVTLPAVDPVAHDDVKSTLAA